MIDLTAYSVIPLTDLTKEPEKDKILKTYYTTLVQMEKMNLSSEILKCLLIAWREDAFYGYTYEDESGFFIMPLDGNYCKVSSVNFDGSLNFAFDFSYFRTNTAYLDFWDKEFQKKYDIYQKDISQRWQELDTTRTLCLKINCEDSTLVIPPFVSLFEQIIDLIDLQSIQAIKDELSVYKLLVANIETMKNSDEPNDFSVDIDTALLFFDRLVESLPKNVASCISPLPITPIEFKGNTTEDVDMISNSMSNLFKSAGVAQVLDSNQISGSTAFEASLLCDSLMATKILLPQIEVWVNRYLTAKIGERAKIKFIEVTPYTRGKKINELKESAQYGLPVKIALSSLLGFSPLETLSMQYLENDILSLQDKWIPLQSSHTQSAKAGRPQIESDDINASLSPEGEATRSKNKNDKG